MPLTKRRPLMPVSGSLPSLPLSSCSPPTTPTPGNKEKQFTGRKKTSGSSRGQGLHGDWEKLLDRGAEDDVALDALIDIIVRTQTNASDRARPPRPTHSWASASTSDLSRTASTSDHTCSSNAHLLRSTSVVAPSRAANDTRVVPPVPLSLAQVARTSTPRKLHKRRVSEAQAVVRRTTGLDLLNDPPLRPPLAYSDQFGPLTDADAPSLPEGAAPPMAQHVITSSLSRNGSRSTTAPSLRHVSVDSGEPAIEHNRDTFGPVSAMPDEIWRLADEPSPAPSPVRALLANSIEKHTLGPRRRVASGTSRAGREPSLCDFTEILRSAAKASVSSPRSGRFRSSSLGAASLSETIFSLEDILRSGPVDPDRTQVTVRVELAHDTPLIVASPLPIIPLVMGHRRAPLPPHLLAVPRATSDTTDPAHSRSASLGSTELRPPVIPDRSTSLGLLWRRMSGKDVSSSGSSSDTSEVASTSSGADRKRERRPGLIRALSSKRRQDIQAEKEYAADVLSLPPLPATGPPASDSAPTSAAVPFPAVEPLEADHVGSDLHNVRSMPVTPPSTIPRRASSLPVQPHRHRRKQVPPLKVILDSSFTAITENASFPLDGTDAMAESPVQERAAERKRQFRRTLVEVDDDFEFQALLQGLDGSNYLTQPPAPLSPGACCGDDGLETSANTDDELEIRDPFVVVPMPVAVGMEKRTMQAWFVMRELIQGEKRHGRLLARGVAIARSVAERAGLTKHGLPDLSTRRPSYPPRLSPAKRRSRLSRPYTHAGYRKLDASQSFTSISTLTLPLSLRGSTSVIHLDAVEPTEDVSPLDILLHRLPRLLALSLTLSSRFAHDPSPDQVATAFLSMETDLLLELAEWAGEVGQLIAMGLGESLDEELREDAEIRRSSTSDLEALGLLVGPTLADSTSSAPLTAEEKEDARMSFSEVLLGPIQRAARYRLLFHSLSAKMPLGPGRDQVQAALYAAERLVAGVNRRQEFDLEGLRRRNMSMSTVGEGTGLPEESEGEGEIVVRRRKGLGAGRRVKSMYASA